MGKEPSKRYKVSRQITRPIEFVTYRTDSIIDFNERCEFIIREFAIWLLNNIKTVDWSKFKIGFKLIEDKES